MKIGVTGGIGSGKSTFCRFLQACGAVVIDADALAKELMASHPVIREKVIATFGSDSYLPDGSLNRSFLAVEAFHKGRVEELNAIVHPVLFQESDRLMDESEKAGNGLVVKEAALLLKYGRPKNLHKIVLVTAGASTRLERVVKRDSAPEEAVQQRMNAQQDDAELMVLSDIVVLNDGPVDALQHKAEELYRFFQKKQRS